MRAVRVERPSHSLILTLLRLSRDDMKMTIKKQLNEDAQQKQNCSYNRDIFNVSCTCVTMSILHCYVLHNHNTSVSCCPQYSLKQLC